MKTYKIVILFSIFFIKISCTNAQDDNFKLKKVSETIVKYEFICPINNVKYVLRYEGDIEKKIIFKFREYKNWQIYLYSLDENNFTFNQIFSEINVFGNYNNILSIKDSLILYEQKHFQSESDVGYSELSLNSNGNVYLLDSVYFGYKKIHSSFSDDGKFLIINTLNELSDYYNPEQDDRFIIYSLDSLKQSIINKEYIPCDHCSNGNLIGDKFFFTKSNKRDDFSNGFAWKDIYMTSWNNLDDTVKIASFSSIMAISPDGKYILGTRHFDLPNYPCAIFDVENKKYQLLLGRPYWKYQAFYSYEKEKFAFNVDGRIIYIDFLEEYPFDALRKDNPDIPKWSNDDFYKQFEQEPFSK